MVSAPKDAGLSAHVGLLRERVNSGLAELVPQKTPAALYDSVRYVLAGEGKRFRPVLMLLSGEMFGVEPDRCLPAALAVEVFHNFTLVHDDIMDSAAERRGRPTVHVRWDETTAILCGDYLMALAYELLARVPTPHLAKLVRAFHAMVARLCEGQMLDKEFESRADVSVDDYLDMIDRKTGALLEVSLELGGIVGEADGEELAMLRAIGRDVGRAFQIQDDLLDVTAEDARWGKTIGGDLVEGKKTYLLLRCLEQAKGPDRTWFERIGPHGGLDASEVSQARERMERLGVLEDAREAVSYYSGSAMTRLDRMRDGRAAEALRWLIQRMQVRHH
jgi:geranylgeranyl diphosphate synthase, type II